MTAFSTSALDHSPLYSEELGIALSAGDDDSLFRWFLASALLGARISETIARHTYQSFLRHGLTTAQAILRAGRDFLVNPVMREGGYVRYDGRKSDQILRDCRHLIGEYGGSLGKLHQMASDGRDLEKRLDAFPGVGPVTINIFLRELRPIWSKADPEPLPLVRVTAAELGIDLAAHPRHSIAFSRIEAGLLRLGRIKSHHRRTT